MNKTELASAVATKTGLKKKDAAAAVDAVFEAITDSLTESEKVQIVGFGTFKVKEKPDHYARNPRTGGETFVKASKSPAFTPSKTLKENINK
ncbi:MAG: HU family DNA-binding protein [Firmicutes bacterium]|nr:HU family DNA-binding protein [Bacillota bacterium]